MPNMKGRSAKWLLLAHRADRCNAAGGGVQLTLLGKHGIAAVRSGPSPGSNDPRIGRSRPLPAPRCAAAALRLSSRAAIGALWVPEVCQKTKRDVTRHIIM